MSKILKKKFKKTHDVPLATANSPPRGNNSLTILYQSSEKNKVFIF